MPLKDRATGHHSREAWHPLSHPWLPGLIVIALLVAGTTAFLRVTTPDSAPRGGTIVAHGCPAPLTTGSLEPPLQSDVPASLVSFQARSMTLTPLAGFSVDARVLSRRDYDSGRESELSPTDLALGWGRMRDDTVLAQLEITQSSRWFHYRYQNNPPIPTNELTRSAANMHMIPADAAVADALDEVEKDERVRIDGWLVEAKAPDGWRWRSSTSREDTGAGACELVYVCSITRLTTGSH